MKHDPFEFNGLTRAERWWRIVFLVALITVLGLDLFLLETMMTVEEVTDDDLFKRMSSAYDQVVAVLDGHKLDRDEGFSLLAQILCQLSQDDRDDFMWKMNKFYSMERFLRPQPTEVH